MAFRRKATKLLALAPNLLIVPESEHPEKLGIEGLALFTQHIWIGDNPNKGLGIYSCSPLFNLRLHDCYDRSIKFIAPIEVFGPFPFQLIAVWAMDNKDLRSEAYIGRVWKAISLYAHLLGPRTIIVGDFNWNAIWDRPTSKIGNFTKVASRLSEESIFSCYHRFSGEKLGEENAHTLFLQKNQLKAYHIDYIFASPLFLDALDEVFVGGYEDWIGSSDHMPLLASFRLPSE